MDNATPQNPNDFIIKAHEIIDEYFEKLVNVPNTSFRPRKHQINLSKAIASSIIRSIVADSLKEDVLLSEAPTGTGKSIAYLVGALAAQRAIGSSTSTPVQVVAATATKALQSQLLNSDVPKLIDAKIITSNDATIAKGKSNYLCLKRAIETLDALKRFDEDPEGTYLDELSYGLETSQVETLIEAYEQNTWDGDFDTFSHFKVSSIRPLNVASDLCTQAKCPHYKSCAYFSSIQQLANKKIVISNHDLVLRDLQLQFEGATSTLGKKIPRYILIVDEAHNLPEKAIEVGKTEGKLSALFDALPKLKGIKKLIDISPVAKKALVEKGINIESPALDRESIDDVLLSLIDQLTLLETDADGNFRFPGGEIPDKILLTLMSLRNPIENMEEFFSGALGVISGLKPEEYAKDMSNIADLTKRITEIKQLVSAINKTVGSYLLKDEEAAKWLSIYNDKVVLNTSPLEGAAILKPYLWDSVPVINSQTGDVDPLRVAAVSMISATLQDVDGFTRFAKKAGVYFEYSYSVLPYIFKYDESTLIVPGMKYTPKVAERKMFINELNRKMPTYLSDKRGDLVLFQSWAMLKDVLPTIVRELGEDGVLVQGTLPINQLVAMHQSRIDAGLGSTLVGVASMAEGLDLPGKYCERVHIVSLPFSSPFDPVEQEVQDRLGSSYFNQRSLPDACTALIQMVGRLIRRESDRGSIVIYDRRLVSTSFGGKLLRALPPFKRDIEPVSAY